MNGSDTILLIEDDPEDVILIKLAFECLKVPNPIVSVRDGLEALEYLDGQGAYTDRVKFPFPRLILLDLRMPRMNGFEFLQWLRIRPLFRSLPVIVITGSVFSHDVTRAYRAGANSFLIKPVDSGQFTAELKQTLSFWLGEEEIHAGSTAPCPPRDEDSPSINPKS
jgi:CheY-like chemotaxis protein